MSPDLDSEQALELARRVVAASSADETEVTVELEAERFARFAEVGPTQSADRRRVSVAVRLRRREPGGGYREARATAGSLEERDWHRALERASRLAGASPVDEQALPLEGEVTVPASRADAETLAHPFAAKARWIGEALDACRAEGLAAAGLARTLGRARALANSAGRAVHGSSSRASFALTASAEDAAGIGVANAARVEDVDAEAAVRRAVEKARRARRPRPIPAGDYTVVLEPLAVSALLLFAAYHGFGAQELAEESSFLCGRIGERVFAPELELWDDASEPRLAAIPFDGEGSPTRRVALIEGGTPRGPVTDRRTARRLGLDCTGHARPQPSASGPTAEHLVVGAGGAELESLIAGVDRGLLVSQLHYTNMIEPRELTLSGMTRNGTFWIEDGEIRHAVHNLRFTDTLVRTLSAVDGVGARREVAGALFSGEVLTPALRVRDFRFTSTTDF